MTHDLITAVDALTKPTRTKVIRDDGSTVVVSHDPLLVQLEQAITSAVGSDAGNGGQSTGNVLNGAAMYLYSIISSQVTDWCRIAKLRPPTRRPADNLGPWMVAACGFQDVTFYVKTLRSWAGQIQELLDPPVRVELNDPCVACGALRYVTADGEVKRPVVVSYDRTLLHASLRAVCRVCEVEWDGPDAVGELVDEMKERHPIPELEES